MKVKNISLEIICCLFILLFGYTAVSKIIDFRSFWVDISRNFSVIDKFDMAKPIAVLVILFELLVVFFLLMPKFRRVGLIGALGLMIFFTFYVARILSFAKLVPCTCGGVLRQMTWGQHLWFNVFFTGLAILGVFFHRRFFSSNSIRGKLG